jgi:hypothetical protein
VLRRRLRLLIGAPAPAAPCLAGQRSLISAAPCLAATAARQGRGRVGGNRRSPAACHRRPGISPAGCRSIREQGCRSIREQGCVAQASPYADARTAGDPSVCRATRSEPTRYITRSAQSRRRWLACRPYGVAVAGSMVTDRFYDVRYHCGTAAWIATS